MNIIFFACLLLGDTIYSKGDAKMVTTGKGEGQLPVLKVLSVIDEYNLLCTLPYYTENNDLVWVRFTTKRHPDIITGGGYYWDYRFRMTGTTSYETVTGAKRTIPLAIEVDEAAEQKEKADQEEKDRKQDEKRKTIEWKSADGKYRVTGRYINRVGNTVTIMVNDKKTVVPFSKLDKASIDAAMSFWREDKKKINGK